MDEKARIHSFYVLSILITVIIGLITVKWNDIPKLPELITFALTVSSLVLAVLAIVYAYVSNVSSQQMMSRLSSAAETLVHASDDVRKATSQLATQVSDIPALVTSVSERVDKTNALLREYAASPKDGAPPPLQQDQKVRAIAFLDNISVAGMLSLIAFARAYRAKKKLNLTDFVEKTKAGNPQYNHGFLIAAGGSGLIGCASKSTDDIQPLYMSEELVDRVENEFEARVTKNFKNEPETIKFFLGLLAAVKSYNPC